MIMGPSDLIKIMSAVLVQNWKYIIIIIIIQLGGPSPSSSKWGDQP